MTRADDHGWYAKPSCDRHDVDTVLSYFGIHEPDEWASLKEFFEQGAFGERPGRTAYAVVPDRLPEPADGLHWCQTADFDAALALRADPGLKPVFDVAVQMGFASVQR
ncbi:hypothetical protein AAE026_29385 [Bradyrhizobium sp. DN5]|uniref:hypothetical protein n=1 Tax=Bradyrhizobium sp. DN5 TaxID=3056950 RepID=UPI0035242B23